MHSHQMTNNATFGCNSSTLDCFPTYSQLLAMKFVHQEYLSRFGRLNLRTTLNVQRRDSEADVYTTLTETIRSDRMVWTTRIGAVILILVVFINLFNFQAAIAEQRCESILKHGRWQHDDGQTKWQSFGSMTALWDAKYINSCLNGEKLRFVGDSIARELLWAMARKINASAAIEKEVSVDRHQSFTFEQGNISLQFVWDPFVQLNDSVLNDLIHVEDNESLQLPVIWSTGLWQTRHHGDHYLESLNQALVNIQDISSNTSRSAIVVPPPYMQREHFDLGKAATLTRQRISHVNLLLQAFSDGGNTKVAWTLRDMTYRMAGNTSLDGIHVGHGIADQQADVLLGYMCNHIFSKTNKASSYACAEDDGYSFLIKVLTMIGLILLLVVQPRDGSLFDHLAAISGTLAYCYISDRTSTYSKANKLVSQYFFLLSTCSILLVCLASKAIFNRWKQWSQYVQHTSTGTLSRDHTDEIKGWMQIVILFYHYYGMSSTFWIYKLVRLLVAAYLFLLGYGHSTYFRKTGDFSFRRLVTVLLRINMLSCSLALIMNTSYDFYYFPCISTVWFLVIWITCHCQQNLSSERKLTTTLVAACMVHFFLKYPEMLKCLLSWMDRLHGPRIEYKELIFRLKLDHLVPFYGMLVADLQTRFSTRCSTRTTNRYSLKLVFFQLTSFVILISTYIAISHTSQNKYQYNTYHPYISILPIVAYIVLCGMFSSSSISSSTVLIALGKNSLELYILQYHIWLASDTKGLLRYEIIDSPLIADIPTPVARSYTYALETVWVTMVFFLLSNIYSCATDFIVKRVTDCGQYTLMLRISFILSFLWLPNAMTAERTDLAGRQH